MGAKWWAANLSFLFTLSFYFCSVSHWYSTGYELTEASTESPAVRGYFVPRNSRERRIRDPRELQSMGNFYFVPPASPILLLYYVGIHVRI